ncbi:MAG: ATP-binding protein [Gemmataceae bacterium]|nr:ATP-binding protein [Gemmataceae bacterium]MCS7269587.1 ATP-binding protein [Gemmataceae bacterium]MDW8244382.1 ATP-binding protein [Thermogemmata sp.]
MTATILILEDDAGTARLQQRRLERAGYRTEWTPQAQQAWLRLQQGGIDLLLLDQHFDHQPEDGLSFYSRLQAAGCNVPVILVTGRHDDSLIIRALRAGVRDYIFKSPEYLDYLPEAVQRVLEQVRLQKQLAESQARLAAIIETAFDAIITLDQQQRITTFNPAAERIFGIPAAQALGQPIRTFLPEGLVLEPMAAGRPQLLGEVEGRRRDGSRVPLEVSCAHAQRQGQVVCTLVLRDISERKQTLEQLRARTEELRQTTRQLWQAARLAGVGELAASIAHELNNPLGTISLRLEGILAKTPPSDPRRKPLEIIEAEIERMCRLVANLLQFSRPGNDQFSTVELTEEVEKTLDLFSHHLRKRRISVQTDFQADIPPISADRQQLRQVLLNLFSNAADAMPEGGQLTVRLRRGSLPEGQAAIVLEVSDTGIGIAPEHLPHVFDPFFTTKEEGKGTGLGLPICKRIIEQQHQGRISIESQPGQGTTVRILLPLLKA